MAKPRIRDVNAAKRLARYLSTRTRMICHFKKQKMPKEIEAWSDSDWAGCLETRKSTSGGPIKFGTHILKSWSITQNTIALSSGEAEFYAMVKAGSQGLGMRSMLEDVGIQSNVKIITDATAARGMAQRKGLGAVRHVEVHQLWIQDKVHSKEICVEKVGGKSNLADGLTKFVDGKDLAIHVDGIGLENRTGRHTDAPVMAAGDAVKTVRWADENEDTLE